MEAEWGSARPPGPWDGTRQRPPALPPRLLCEPSRLSLRLPQTMDRDDACTNKGKRLQSKNLNQATKAKVAMVGKEKGWLRQPRRQVGTKTAAPCVLLKDLQLASGTSFLPRAQPSKHVPQIPNSQTTVSLFLFCQTENVI